MRLAGSGRRGGALGRLELVAAGDGRKVADLACLVHGEQSAAYLLDQQADLVRRGWPARGRRSRTRTTGSWGAADQAPARTAGPTARGPYERGRAAATRCRFPSWSASRSASARTAGCRASVRPPRSGTPATGGTARPRWTSSTGTKFSLRLMTAIWPAFSGPVSFASRPALIAFASVLVDVVVRRHQAGDRRAIGELTRGGAVRGDRRAETVPSYRDQGQAAEPVERQRHDLRQLRAVELHRASRRPGRRCTPSRSVARPCASFFQSTPTARRGIG